jgi:hypothetical protein
MKCSLKDTSVAEQSICLIRLFCMGLRVQTPLATTTSQYCAAFSRITKDMRCHQPQDDRVSLSLATWSRLYSCRRNQWQHNISCAAARGEGWNKTIQSGGPVGKLKAPLPLLPACMPLLLFNCSARWSSHQHPFPSPPLARRLTA